MLKAVLLGQVADVEALLYGAQRHSPRGLLLDMHCFRQWKRDIVLQAPLCQAAAACAKVLDLLAELKRPGQICLLKTHAHCTSRSTGGAFHRACS